MVTAEQVLETKSLPQGTSALLAELVALTRALELSKGQRMGLIIYVSLLLLTPNILSLPLDPQDNVFLFRAHSYAAFHNRSNCWVCRELPSSSVEGFPWWTSPLQGKDFLHALAGRFFTTEPPGKPLIHISWCEFSAKSRSCREPGRPWGGKEPTKWRWSRRRRQRLGMALPLTQSSPCCCCSGTPRRAQRSLHLLLSRSQATRCEGEIGNRQTSVGQRYGGTGRLGRSGRELRNIRTWLWYLWGQEEGDRKAAGNHGYQEDGNNPSNTRIINLGSTDLLKLYEKSYCPVYVYFGGNRFIVFIRSPRWSRKSKYHHCKPLCLLLWAKLVLSGSFPCLSRMCACVLSCSVVSDSLWLH